MTQLEQPVAAARRALAIARAGGARTVLNPAPAAQLPEGMLALCDIVTPNESEAAALTGIEVTGPDSARAAAAAALRAQGAGIVIVTLGALFDDSSRVVHLPALVAGPVVDTTGAGDAFTGGLAAALAGGADPLDAARRGIATAALAVTRPGTAGAMPTAAEIAGLMARA